MSKFDQAMAESEDLIHKLQECAHHRHPIRCLLRDIWLYRDNIPYVTTLYEANEEMTSPLRQNGRGY
jgi:hypothetical protein